MRRMLVCVAGAAVVAVALFWLMQWMIAPDDTLAERPPSSGPVTFTRIERDEDARRRDREPPPEPEPPQRPETLPELDTMDTPPAPDMDLDLAGLDLSDLGTGPALATGGLLWAGDATPLVQVEPQYPRRALMAGTEGHVTMEFTIERDGSVSDVTVIEAEPPGVFNAEAVRALMRWRFRPHVVDGEPRARRARQTIHFSLDEGAS